MNEPKRITLTVNDEDIDFNVRFEDYNKLINSLSNKDKVAPMHNFCVLTVADEDKNKLLEILKMPGAALQIATELIEEYAPTLNIIAKKPRSEASKSAITA